MRRSGGDRQPSWHPRSPPMKLAFNNGGLDGISCDEENADADILTVDGIFVRGAGRSDLGSHIQQPTPEISRSSNLFHVLCAGDSEATIIYGLQFNSIKFGDGKIWFISGPDSSMASSGGRRTALAGRANSGA